MGVPVVDALRAEEARLEAELQHLPIYQQLQAIRDSIQKLTTVYAEVRINGAGHLDAEATVVSARNVQPAPRRTRHGSMAGTVTATAWEHFITTRRRATSGQIMELLRARGVEIAGAKPQAQIASILSHDPRFHNGSDSHGGGYGLRVWAEEPVPAPPDGSDPEPEAPEAAA